MQNTVEQIRRVIHNIIGNAIKYMDKPKGIIQIRVKDVGDFIQIEIEDNGKGIGAKDIAYIFDRFYRTDVSEKFFKRWKRNRTFHCEEDYGRPRRKSVGNKPAGHRNDHVLCSRKYQEGQVR